MTTKNIVGEDNCIKKKKNDKVFSGEKGVQGLVRSGRGSYENQCHLR